MCVKKTEDVVVLNDNRNYNDNPETVEYVNNEYADVYGMKYDPTTATDYKGDKNTLYNRYSEINSTGKVEQHSGISIINNSDMNKYFSISELQDPLKSRISLAPTVPLYLLH